MNLVPQTSQAAAVLGAAWLFISCSANSRSPLTPETMSLSNGMSVVVVHLPDSPHVSIFSFLPLALGVDGPDQAQWSHLVEHLVVRSTISGDLREANAETMHDHMRLDFYGDIGNWTEGLRHHQRWLAGIPFTSGNLAAEKPKVIAECDFTARNVATHKFGLAAWAQGFRHGKSHIRIKGDVLDATLEMVQRHRDEYLFVPGATTICAVGGVDAKTFFAEAEKELGQIQSRARLVPATAASIPESRDVTWDMDAHHLVQSWPIPGPAHEDYAALLATAQWLTTQLMADASLKEIAGMTLAGADLFIPEGAFFYVSASLRPPGQRELIEKKMEAHVRQLAANSEKIAQLGAQLSFSLRRVANPAILRAQATPEMSRAMIEGNAGLWFATQVHRYQAHRAALARRLDALSRRQVENVIGKYLAAERRAVTMLRPGVEAKPN